MLFNIRCSIFRLYLRISTTPRLCLNITPLANSPSSRCPIIIPSWWHPIHITKAFLIFHQTTAKVQFKGPLNKALIPKMSHLVSRSPRWTFKTNHSANHLIQSNYVIIIITLANRIENNILERFIVIQEIRTFTIDMFMSNNYNI